MSTEQLAEFRQKLNAQQPHPNNDAFLAIRKRLCIFAEAASEYTGYAASIQFDPKDFSTHVRLAFPKKLDAGPLVTVKPSIEGFPCCLYGHFDGVKCHDVSQLESALVNMMRYYVGCGWLQKKKRDAKKA